jgi:uncharacterized protein YwgA
LGKELKNRSDIELLLLLFHLNNGAIRGRKRIQKLVFLLKKQYEVPFRFDFKPYFYGPYSEELAETMQILVQVGLLRERVSVLESGFAQYSYGLTREAADIIRKSKVPDLGKFKRAVALLYTMSTSELVRLSKKLLP